MQTELIRYDRAALTVLPPDDQALELVNQCLNTLAAVPCDIDTEAEQSQAVAAQREAKTILKAVETNRKLAKEPILTLCKAIDSAAEKLVEEIKSEELRVAQAVGSYQQRILEVARRAARERAEAEAKLEAEKQAELERVRKEQEAIAIEARRKADAEAAAARNQAQREAAEKRRVEMEAELARREQAAQQRVHDLAAQNAEAVLPPVVAPIKAEGQIVREVWCHEVTDIHALYRANPGLVEMKPRAREIGELLARGVTSIPGLRAWKETRASARINAASKAIDV